MTTAVMRTLLRNTAPVVAVAFLGCGGGGASTRTTPPALDERGNVVTTGGGDAVTQEAHSRWATALEKFNQFERAGWNADRCNEAVGAFEAAFGAQSSFVEAYYMAGLAASKCGDATRALSFYNRALEANPQMCNARAAIGLAHLEAGRTAQARQEFERAIRDDPQRCMEAYVNLAVVQAGVGGAQIQEAISNLRRALAIESAYLPAFNQLALIYLSQANTNRQALDLAGVVCRQAQLNNRDYAPIYNTWGLVHLKQGDLIAALLAFNRARELDNRLYEAHMNFGQITISFRGYEDARDAFSRAVELQPRSYDAQIGLGAALRGLNLPAEAQARYEAAIQIDAGRPEAYFNLGVLSQDYMSGSIEDLSRAKAYFEQFLSHAGSRSNLRDQIQDVRRTCQQQANQGGRRQRRSSRDCRPGRMQNIDTAIGALRAAAAMQQQPAAAASAPAQPAAGGAAP